mgnify:CR=1 FL=1
MRAIPMMTSSETASADAKGLDASCLERLDYTPPFTGSFGWEP